MGDKTSFHRLSHNLCKHHDIIELVYQDSNELSSQVLVMPIPNRQASQIGENFSIMRGALHEQYTFGHTDAHENVLLSMLQLKLLTHNFSCEFAVFC